MVEKSVADLIAKHVAEAARTKAARDEAITRSLLEQWVSEIPPALAMRDGRIIGLCDADAPIGSHPFIFRGR